MPLCFRLNDKSEDDHPAGLLHNSEIMKLVNKLKSHPNLKWLGTGCPDFGIVPHIKREMLSVGATHWVCTYSNRVGKKDDLHVAYITDPEPL